MRREGRIRYELTFFLVALTDPWAPQIVEVPKAKSVADQRRVTDILH
jgi:hypothetical protein